MNRAESVGRNAVSPPSANGKTWVLLFVVLTAIAGMGWWGFGKGSKPRPIAATPAAIVPSPTAKP